MALQLQDRKRKYYALELGVDANSADVMTLELQWLQTIKGCTGTTLVGCWEELLAGQDYKEWLLTEASALGNVAHGIERLEETVFFRPELILADGEIGGYYDPSDLSTLWQDSSGTIPVTTDGQAVARIDDKSGNGLHLTQGAVAERPLYKTNGTEHWLQFDGVDDYLDTTNNFGLQFTDGVSAVVAISNADVNRDFATVFSQNDNSAQNSFALTIGDRGAGAGLSRIGTDVWGIAGTYGSTNLVVNTPTICSWVIKDWSQHFTQGIEMWVDGAAQTVSVLNPGSAPTGLGDGTLKLGVFGANTGSTFSAGNFYGGIIVKNRQLGSIERQQLEQYFQTKI